MALSAFKMKKYNLEPIYASWTDCPVFTGDSKSDLPLNEWLEVVKAGCVSRKVPEEYWPKVAQHFMSGTALYRIKEVKKVMQQLHGGLFRWTWSKFRVAMENMEWDEKSKVETRSLTGSFFSFGRKAEEPVPATSTVQPPPPPVPTKGKDRPAPQKSKTMDSTFWSRKKENKDPSEVEKVEPRPPVRKTTSWVDSLPLGSLRSNSNPGAEQDSSSSSSDKGKAVVVAAKAAPPVPIVEEPETAVLAPGSQDGPRIPKWMLDATSALSSLKSDHPKVMNLAAAILIGLGSIPAMPGIAAGAGGAIFASGTVQAVGAIAVGLGQMISAVATAPPANPNGQEVGRS